MAFFWISFNCSQWSSFRSWTPGGQNTHGSIQPLVPGDKRLPRGQTPLRRWHGNRWPVSISMTTSRGVPVPFCMLRQFSSYVQQLLKCWVSTQDRFRQGTKVIKINSVSMTTESTHKSNIFSICISAYFQNNSYQYTIHYEFSVKHW